MDKEDASQAVLEALRRYDAEKADVQSPVFWRVTEGLALSVFVLGALFFAALVRFDYGSSGYSLVGAVDTIADLTHLIDEGFPLEADLASAWSFLAVMIALYALALLLLIAGIFAIRHHTAKEARDRVSLMLSMGGAAGFVLMLFQFLQQQ